MGKLIGGESNTWQGKGASMDAPEKLESHFMGRESLVNVIDSN